MKGGGGELAYEMGRDTGHLAEECIGFWSHLRCSGENAIMYSPYGAVKISVWASREEI